MIRILTDSASDILPAEAEQLGVTVIPLNVTLEDGTVLRDGIDKTPSGHLLWETPCHTAFKAGIKPKSRRRIETPPAFHIIML